MSADGTDNVTDETAENMDAEASTEVEEAEPVEGEVIDLEDGDVIELGAALVEPDPTEALRQELEDTVARLKAVSGAYRTLQSDMKAFQERQRRQQLLKQEILKGDTVSRLFSPVQNLRRSVDAMSRAGVGEDWIKGLEMIHGAFMRGFQDLGLEEVPGVGASFDPSIHEALTVMPVTQPEQHDTVIQVFDAGFRVGTRLIRPAKVILGQYSAPAEEE